MDLHAQDPEISAVLAAFPGARLIPEDENPSDETEGNFVVAESTTLSEIIFGTIGPQCHERGWCVIPQQRSGRRLPSIYHKEAIKWGLYFDERPDAKLVDKWAVPCFNENVSLILGPPSGYVWSLDLDIKDWRLAEAVEDLAFEILGHTPYKRIGNRPKRALFYRAATPRDLPKNLSRMFVDEDGSSASPHGIELLGHKKMQTIYGRHHETFDHFAWGGPSQPALTKPTDVPATTIDQVDRFLTAVQQIRAFHRNGSGQTFDVVDFVDDGTVRRPRLGPSSDWVVEDGKVVDGREKFLWALAKEAARANAGLCAVDGRGQLRALVLEEFKSRASIDGRWVRDLLREVNDKVDRAAQGILEGKSKPIPQTVKKISRKQEVVSADASWMTSGRKDGLAWLPPAIMRGEIKDVPFSDDAFTGTALAAIQIPATAAESSARIAEANRLSIQAFFADIDGQDPSDHARTHIAAGPTGAGKTAMTLEQISDMERGDYPILFLVPNYGNVGEIAKKARDLGMAKDDIVEFMGKARCGTLTTEDRCIRHDDVLRLQKAGRSTAGLCEWSDPDDEEVTIQCPHFAVCRYQQQMAKVPTAKIVFAVHAYVSCTSPAVFKDIEVAVVDESFHDQLLKSERFKDDVLLLPRNGVAFLTKKEKSEGINPISFMEARDFLGAEVREWIRKHRDPADWFLRDEPSLSTDTKITMLDRTISLLSRVIDDGTVKPTTSSAMIEKMCAAPERKFVHQEEKFWRLVKDRVLLAKGNAKEGSLAKGKRDVRILWQRGPKSDAPGTIRISWITQHNLENKHVLALDASASTSLVARVLGRKETEIVAPPIDALLRVRTVHIAGRSFAKTSLLPRIADDEPMEAFKSRLRTFLRNFISHVAAMHPSGGIVVCMPKALKRLIRRGWAGPKRVLWMHYGYTRGLNIAEKCDAAIAIGCISPSIQQLDDIVAALAYGDDDPEQPIDLIGEHRDQRDEELETAWRNEKIRLRNGHAMTVRQRSANGRYARLALDQIRREEHLQFLGRLRPIHRDRVTSFYNLGSYIPPSLIVDEVIEWTDLKAHIGNAVESAREVGGYIGARDDDEDVRETQRFLPLVQSDAVRSQMFQIAANGEVLYVPAHTPSVLDRYIDEGYEVIAGPTLDDMPAVEDDLEISFEDEVRMRDEAITAALADGWKNTVGSRVWTKTIRTEETVAEGRVAVTEMTMSEDVSVVIDIYVTRSALAEIAADAAEPEGAAEMPGAVDERGEG